MVDMIVKNFPLTEVVRRPKDTYTKAEVDALIRYAIDEARKIDAESMAKHNRDATVISMILGFTALALFVDGLLGYWYHTTIHGRYRFTRQIVDRVEVMC